MWTGWLVKQANISSKQFPYLKELVDDHNTRSMALCKHLPSYWRSGEPDAWICLHSDLQKPTNLPSFRLPWVLAVYTHHSGSSFCVATAFEKSLSLVWEIFECVGESRGLLCCFSIIWLYSSSTASPGLHKYFAWVNCSLNECTYSLTWFPCTTWTLKTAGISITGYCWFLGHYAQYLPQKVSRPATSTNACESSVSGVPI